MNSGKYQRSLSLKIDVPVWAGSEVCAARMWHLTCTYGLRLIGSLEINTGQRPFDW